jgi:hypothetical protein
VQEEVGKHKEQHFLVKDFVLRKHDDDGSWKDCPLIAE